MPRNYVYHPYQFVRATTTGGGVTDHLFLSLSLYASRLQIRIGFIILLPFASVADDENILYNYLRKIQRKSRAHQPHTNGCDAGDDLLSLCRFSRLSMRNSHQKMFPFYTIRFTTHVRCAHISALREGEVGDCSAEIICGHTHTHTRRSFNSFRAHFIIRCRRHCSTSSPLGATDREHPISYRFVSDSAARNSCRWPKTIITITIGNIVLVVKFSKWQFEKLNYIVFINVTLVAASERSKNRSNKHLKGSFRL